MAAPATAPPLLPGVEPGQWEVSRSATGNNARSGCVRDIALLATYAHAGDRCERTLVSSGPREVVLALDCGGGDFGRSTITVTTPRSLKIETQGVRGGEPYDFSIYARRAGDCPISVKR